MKRTLTQSLVTLLAGAGLAIAQPPQATQTQAHPLSSYHCVPATAPGAPDPDSMVPPSGEAAHWPDGGHGGSSGRFWGSAEYLLWWIKDCPLPPLATRGTPTSAGVLGQPGTVLLIGGPDIDNDVRSGGRFRAGFWLDDCQTCGIEASYFFLGSRSDDFSANGAVLARPFFNVNTGAEDAELVRFPGLVGGTFRGSSASRLQGWGGNLVHNLCCGCCSRVDLLAGFRYLELDEGLGLFENVQVDPGAPSVLAGNQVRVFDQFDTRNRFYGGQLGARAEVRRGALFVNVRGLVALGTTEQVVQIFGSTTITPPGGGTTTVPGGLLALSTNSGRFERHRFAVVPEANVNIGCQIAGGLRAFVGYTFLYWNDVARPCDQIDRVLNVTQIPTSTTFGPLVGPARPRFSFKDTDFWAQGINFGLEWRY